LKSFYSCFWLLRTKLTVKGIRGGTFLHDHYLSYWYVFTLAKLCSAYSTSKAGLIMLTKCIAVEYAPMGIRANAICPGQILTDMNLRRYDREAVAQETTREEVMKRAIQTVPLGRIGLPDDVAQVVTFLASEHSDYMTGQALNVTGGQLMEL